MSKILILGAMEEEIKFIKDNNKLEQIDIINRFPLYKKENNKNIVYLLNSGIGKVNGAMSLTEFIIKYDVDHIINIGTCGCLLKEIEIGSIINATELAYHDVDISAAGRPIGELPNENRFFKTSTNKYANKINDDFLKDVITRKGLILTGDQFSSKDKREYILKHFPNALGLEMESAAMVHCANAYKKEITVLRVVSDFASDTAHDEFLDNLNKVCEVYNDLFIKVLNN